MSGAMVAVLGFAGMLVLLGLRMPIGLAMLTAGSLGYIHFTSLAVFLNYMNIHSPSRMPSDVSFA